MARRPPRRMIPEGEQLAPVSKAIGSPDLDSSGKLYPKKLPGESGVLPEEKDPKLPTDGLIVSPALTAEAVLDGRKTLIVKTRPFEIAGKRYLLIGDRKALGVVTLGKLRDVDLDELKRTADQHLISEEVRAERATTQKGWKKGPFYAWPIRVESKFDESVETNIGPDPQVLARDVELKPVEKQIHTDPSHLFFCARLPDEIRKKLTEMSGEILKGVDHAEAEDADHITVLYVPSRGEYSESDKKDALSAIKKVLDAAKPIDAKFQGWGIFDGASKSGEPATALVALVDAPGLAELHTEIKAAMSKAGFTEVDDQTHGFVPHATLAYLPVGARIEKLPVLDAEFKIEKIELVHSDISELDLRGAEKRVVKPFGSPGGKDPWVDALLVRIPKHTTYVEPYAGSATLFFAKERSEKEVLSDKDPEIVATFQFLQKAGDTDLEWMREQDWTGSKKRFDALKARKPESLRERAYRFKYLALYSKRSSYGAFSDTLADRPLSGKAFLSNLEKFRERLRGVTILNKDALDVAKQYDSATTFTYLDPPWRGAAPESWKEFDQEKFVEAVQKLKGKALISYQGDLDLGDGWRCNTLTRRMTGFGGYDAKQQLYQNYTIQKARKAQHVDLIPDLDAGTMTTAELMEAHWRLHALFRGPSEARGKAGFSVENASNLHALVVDELFDRKVPHPPPPGDGMDDVSGDFERHEERQPNYDMPPWERVSKRDYAPINASGVERGPEITLDEVLPHFKTFKTKKPYIYLVGGLANRGKTKGDIDILVKDAEDLSEDFKHVIHFRLGRMLPPELAERLEIHYDGFHGPFTNYVELFDLTLERVNPENEVKLMRDEEAEKRAADPELRAQAERAEKQADPYMEIPNEDKAPYDYTVQEHFRGKSLHCDLRIGFRPGKLLIGWTMNTQIADAIKEPVTTLKQAQQLAKTRMNEYSKINWNTGEWAERPKRGATKLVRTSILSERKAPAPWAWIDVEGKTKDPEPGKPPPVGGTKNFPGVFNIVDRGEVEFGSQKPQFHEYFFTKGALKGRLIFRRLRIQPAKKGAHSRRQCMHTDCKRAPEVDVLWADGRGRAWFCAEHLAEWKQQFGDEGKEDWLDIVGEKKVTSGEVPEKWSDVHKSDDVVISKEVVLPPSKEQDLPGPGWLAIKPDDLTPYVLDSAAVKKNWMPPVGVSALPKAIRMQIPEEYRYWEKKTAAGAKQARDALLLAIKAKDVEIDHSAPYGRTTTKASMDDAHFVLQEQTWRGPVQIHTGPSRTLWHLRLDIGRPELIVAEMYLNPLDNERMAARLTDDPHKESMKFQGVIKAAHYLNPTKTTPSNIEIVDSGKAAVLAYSDKLLKVRLKGELLEGLFEAKRSDSDWLWQPSEPGQKVEKEAGDMADEYRAEFTAQAMIVKTDKEKRLVTGVVLEPDTVDAQKDTIDTEAIERAAHKFLAQYNRETQLGVLHTIFGENGIDLVESWTAKTDFKLGDENVTQGTWLMTVKVLDDMLWKKVKAGEITGFSIGGIATVI